MEKTEVVVQSREERKSKDRYLVTSIEGKVLSIRNLRTEELIPLESTTAKRIMRRSHGFVSAE